MKTINIHSTKLRSGGLCAVVFVGLAATLLSAAHAQEKDAEKLLRAMEKKIKDAKAAKLTLMDGPTVALRCYGGRNGTRWVKAMQA